MSSEKRRRKLPKRLFKQRPSDAKSDESYQLPAWLKKPQTQAEHAIAAVNVRLPGRQQEQAELATLFAIHRVVNKPGGQVMQIATQLLMGDTDCIRMHENGVPIPPEVKAKMPALLGRQHLELPEPRTVAWFADFEQKLRNFTMSEATGGRVQVSDAVPSVAVVATDDDRIVGYASASLEARGLVFVRSTPGSIDFSRVTIIPQANGMKFPSVNIAWTARNYRGQGISASLLQRLVTRFTGSPLVAYEAPFSMGGLRLIQHVAGLNFWASIGGMGLMMIAAPLDGEHALTQCHNRRVIENESELQAATEKAREMGYTPFVPDELAWSQLSVPLGAQKRPPADL
jgi:GNAT superfamily N-acetyltransferase